MVTSFNLAIVMKTLTFKGAEIFSTGAVSTGAVSTGAVSTGAAVDVVGASSVDVVAGPFLALSTNLTEALYPSTPPTFFARLRREFFGLTRRLLEAPGNVGRNIAGLGPEAEGR